MNVIVAKIAIAVGCILLVGLAVGFKKLLLKRLEKSDTVPTLAIAWIVFRLLPFLLIYLFLGIEPTSDVVGFWEEAYRAIAGQVVYRDFWSPYSPLYPYFLGVGLLFWYNAKMIVLTMCVMDGLALLIANNFYREQLPKAELLWRSIVYLILPGSLSLCVIGGQEDVWIWLFVMLGLLVRKRTGSVVFYSLIIALGILTTKVIFILPVALLFWLENRKVQFVVPMALVGVVAVGVLYSLVGMEFLQPLDEADTLRAPNLLSVLNPLLLDAVGTGKKFWNWIGLFISLGVGLYALLTRPDGTLEFRISKAFVALYATMMIVQQTAYSNYVFLFLLPLALYILDWSDQRQVILLALYNVLCVIHPSLWWRLGMPKYSTPADIWQSSLHILDYLMQVAVVVMTVFLIRRVLRAKESIIY